MALGWTDETCEPERAQLLAGTQELENRTRELADPKRPFSPAELKAQIRLHKTALADFTLRCLARDSLPSDPRPLRRPAPEHAGAV
jgi:hypothetical protein